MASERAVAAAETRLHRHSAWFDPESAAVVTILLGLFQILLSVPFFYTTQTLPQLFVLPLVLGILIMVGGSFAMANERKPSRQLLQGCAFSNVASLLGVLIGFCLYCYTLTKSHNGEPCIDHFSVDLCPSQILAAYSWSMALLLLLCDIGALVMHCILSVSAFKTLKTN